MQGLQADLQKTVEDQTHRATDSSEMKRSGIELVAGEQMRVLDNFILPVAMRSWVTPVPIPNTMVKPRAADDTALETVWESRWLPDFYGLIAQLVRAHA